MCACVQDFADYESFEQQRYESTFYTKHKMAIHSKMPIRMRNR